MKTKVEQMGTYARLEYLLPGKVLVYYAHLRWSITLLCSLIWLLLSRDLSMVPVVAVISYFLAHYPSLVLVNYSCRTDRKQRPES